MKRAETSRKASSAEGGAAAGGGVALAVAAAAGEAGAAFGAEAQASAKRQSAEAAASERSERAMPSLLPETAQEGAPRGERAFHCARGGGWIDGRHRRGRQPEGGTLMPMVKMFQYQEASPEARAVFDDIMATRKIDWVNNFWKVLASHVPTLQRIWENVKQVMAPGALDPLVKEMIYVAVSVTNNCEYCIHSHTAAARAKGMSDAQLAELLAVVGLANETNRLANGYRVPVDPPFIPEHS